jgi:hypothetical protein
VPSVVAFLKNLTTESTEVHRGKSTEEIGGK